MTDKKKPGLFDPTHLDRITEAYKDWENNRQKPEDAGKDQADQTHSGLPVKLLHTPADLPALDYI
ncbi:MAG: hypothetical protein WA974_01950, partial [Thermodesulfobacteriota bacterium]